LRFGIQLPSFIEGDERRTPLLAVSDHRSAAAKESSSLIQPEKLVVSSQNHPIGMTPNWHQGQLLLLDLL
jgi:hypothetical protein